jgi:cell division septation protein DedD
MPKNEDGEFELILGNRQLLSVFFIVVVLLGVFFTMGYIVGRNSTPLSAEARSSARDSKPLEVESARPLPSQPASATQSVAPAAKPAAGEEKQPETAASKSATEQTKAPESASPTPEEPAPGQTYLQVAAVQQREAELFVDVLAKKGFHALYAPVPDKPATYRVLVGPFKDPAAIAQARTDLQKAGFKGFEALVRKY